MPDIGNWRYGLVLVDVNDDDGDVAELMELYLDESGKPIGFCQPHLGSAVAIRMALNDVENHGVERHFYQSGNFTWNTETLSWDWEKSEE